MYSFVLHLLAVALLLPVAAWAGGSDDQPDVHEDNGPTYFGFVKDTSGRAIGDAKVTADIKGRGTVITRTTAAGSYKLPGFGKEITPDKVVISCSKEGYQQTRLLRRTPVSKQPLIAVETECTMQRAGGK
ncbi:MAG TPA: carboxypeptidase-like regulatory domain-containing protein [Candidatus Binatia bacterium]